MKTKPERELAAEKASERKIDCIDAIMTRDEERDIMIGIVRSQLAAIYEVTGSVLALLSLIVPTRDASKTVQEKIGNAASKAGLAVSESGVITRPETGPVFGRAGDSVE